MERGDEWLANPGGAWHLKHGELAVTACYMPLPQGDRRADELPDDARSNWREEVCWACARIAGIHTG